jgi:hypothetical protein
MTNPRTGPNAPLSASELDKVAGGLNPQPLPPGFADRDFLLNIGSQAGGAGAGKKPSIRFSAQHVWRQRVRPLAGPTINLRDPIGSLASCDGFREGLDRF